MLTDTEIVKSLESLLDRMRAYESQQASIGKGLVEDIISMYNRQKVEIERYLHSIKLLEKDVEELRKGFTADADYFESEYDTKIKFEAIKEFATLIKRRLNSNTSRGAYLIDIINNLVKEMKENKHET